MKSSTIRAHLDTAARYAELSKAKRLKVGVIIVKDDRIISIGINGQVSGGSNECEEIIDGKLVTKDSTIHAEMNAILFAAKNGISTNHCIMIMTHNPCMKCAPAIIQAGISEIWYEHDYRMTDSIEFLKQNNVGVEKWHNVDAQRKKKTS